MAVVGKKMSARKELQIKMTLFVTSAVLLVSAVVLLVVAVRVHDNYDGLLQDRISDDLTAISRIMEQRLFRVEDATDAMAEMTSLVRIDRDNIDSVLSHGLRALDDVFGVSIIFDKDYGRAGVSGKYYERFAYFDADGKIKTDIYIHNDDFENDEDWVLCHSEGKSHWGELFTEQLNANLVISYFVPLTDSGGKCFGMVYTAVPIRYLTSFVTEYKLREDIDISIFKANGNMVVAPDDYVRDIPAGRLMVQEGIIDHIGWKVVLSADNKVVHRKVSNILVSMCILFVLMFLIIYLVIRFTVRYVAKPFVKKQQLVEQERAVMENEMELAAEAQRELIPSDSILSPQGGNVDIAACLHPARRVGGDLYDYFLLDGKLFFCIGDVSGKGVQASLFMAAAHYLFRSMAANDSLADTARKMNVSLCTDNRKCRFITLWMGSLDLDSGKLEYVNAGHDSPVFIHGGNRETFPASENMPIGVWEGEEYQSSTLRLAPGDILLLYTDGVSEAMNATGKEYGKEKLGETVVGAASGKASDIVGAVLGSVREHLSGAEQNDDITMLCLKFIGKE